jgi:hypothetical protein
MFIPAERKNLSAPRRIEITEKERFTVKNILGV